MNKTVRVSRTLVKHSLVSACALSLLAGCDQLTTSRPDPTKDAVDRMIAASSLGKQCAAENRFRQTDVYPMVLWADIALDSCTGQLCRTWESKPKTANTPWESYADIPLCVDLPNAKA